MSKVNAEAKNLMVEVETMLTKRGMPLTERNKINLIQGVDSFRRRYRDWKRWNEEQKHDERLANRHLTPEREAHGRAWAAKQSPPVEILSQQALERCVAYAEIEFEQAQKDYAAAVAEGQRLHQEAIAYQQQVATDALSKPMADNPVYRKYSRRLTPLSEDNVEIYRGYSIDDLRKMCDLAKYNATNDLMLDNPPSAFEFAAVAKWIDVNYLDPGCQENWSNGFLCLQEIGVLRPQSIPTHVIEMAEPRLPEAPEPVKQSKTSGYATNQAEVFANAVAEIKAGPVGQYLAELPNFELTDIFVSEVYNEMFAKRVEITRDNVRKFAYFNMRKHRILAANIFDDSEVLAWTVDAQDAGKVSSEQYRKQVELFGNFSLSRGRV